MVNLFRSLPNFAWAFFFALAAGLVLSTESTLARQDVAGEQSQGGTSIQNVQSDQVPKSDDSPKIRPQRLPGGENLLEREMSWEYEKYVVQVWLIDDGTLQLRSLGNRIKQRIERDAKLEDFEGWKLSCQPAPPDWNSRLESSWNSGLAQWSGALADVPALMNTDKLILVRLGKNSDGFSIDALEFDLSTHQWSTLTKLSASESDRVPAQAFAAVRRSFMPLVRIERVANEMVYVRTRATACSLKLIQTESGEWKETTNENSPLWVRDKDVLLPIIRRDTRDNRLASVEPVSWTFLTVQERIDSTLKCMTHTAHFSPLAGRSGALIKKFAIVVRPEPKPTQVYVTAQEAKTPSPIAGLEIYTCRPEELLSKDYKLFGKTDWKGAIAIPPAEDGTIRYIIVRNGSLATKKPILPGLYDSVTASIPSDRARVFAEGVVDGLRGQIIDVAARRATLKMRIELALEQKKFDRAEKLLNEEYLKLPTIRELNILLAQTKERLMSRKDADQSQRKRIEAMFSGLEQGIAKKLVDRDATELTNRVLNKISTPRPKDEDQIENSESPSPENASANETPPATPPTDQLKQD